MPCLSGHSRSSSPTAKQIVVRHPEWILHPPGQRTVVMMETEGRLLIIDVMLVQQLELDPPIPAWSLAPDPKGGN